MTQASDVILSFQRQINDVAGTYIRAALAQGDACEIVLYVNHEGDVKAPTVKAKPRPRGQLSRQHFEMMDDVRVPRAVKLPA